MMRMTAQNGVSRRPFSKAGRGAPDLRLVLGVLLVVGSVAGVYGIVAAADRRVTVYAAASALTPGERIDAGDLFVTRSRTPYEVKFQSPPGQELDNLSIHIAVEPFLTALTLFNHDSGHSLR